jgi:hypothetical protein
MVTVELPTSMERFSGCSKKAAYGESKRSPPSPGLLSKTVESTTSKNLSNAIQSRQENHLVSHTLHTGYQPSNTTLLRHKWKP